MSTRRRLTKDARRAELLAAAEQLFSERPFDDVSIDDIAAAAGISKNLIYHYFAGKRELFLAVVAAAAEHMLAATRPDPTLAPMAQLSGSLGAHLDYAVAHAQGYVALLRGAGGDEQVQAIVSAAQDEAVGRILASLPPDAAAAPEIGLALRGWIGLVDALTLHWLEHRDLPQERVRELLTELFVAVLSGAGRVAAR